MPHTQPAPSDSRLSSDPKQDPDLRTMRTPRTSAASRTVKTTTVIPEMIHGSIPCNKYLSHLGVMKHPLKARWMELEHFPKGTTGGQSTGAQRTVWQRDRSRQDSRTSQAQGDSVSKAGSQRCRNWASSARAMSPWGTLLVQAGHEVPLRGVTTREPWQRGGAP